MKYRIIFRLWNRLGRELAYHYHAWFQFKPRPDDIFIITYPKSGTTWVLAMLYQILTDGNMDFGHIDDNYPWFGYFKGRNFDGLKSPRIFRSHRSYWHFPNFPGRYIYVYRNGMDVAVSFYYHLKRFDQNLAFDNLFNSWMKNGCGHGLWARHVAAWLHHKQNINILFLKYEDMIASREATVRKIAAFCKVDLKESEMPRILERSSFEFMKEHETQMAPQLGLTDPGFFRRGKPDTWKTHLNPEQTSRFKQQYEKYLGGSNLDYC
jgi:hypothetical protein